MRSFSCVQKDFGHVEVVPHDVVGDTENSSIWSSEEEDGVGQGRDGIVPQVCLGFLEADS